MPRSSHWIGLALIVTGLSFLGGQLEAASVGKDEPAHVEPLPGSKFNRVILKASAVERLGIETAAVREMMAVRKRQVAAIVVDASELQRIGLAAGASQLAAGISHVAGTSPSANAGRAWLRVLPIGDAPKVAQDQPALVIPLVKDAGSRTLQARMVFPTNPLMAVTEPGRFTMSWKMRARPCRQRRAFSSNCRMQRWQGKPSRSALSSMTSTARRGFI